MLKTTILLFITIFMWQNDSVRGNAMLIKTEPETKDSPRLQHSWQLPSFSSFSISSLFKDKEKSDDIAILKKKVEALEESQSQIFELLKQFTIASKSTICTDKLNSTQLSDDEQSGKESGKMEESSAMDDKVGYYTTENVFKDETGKDDVTTIKGDDSSTIAPPINIAEERIPSTQMDENDRRVAAVTGNEEQETTNENHEKVESMERDEKATKIETVHSTN